MTKEVKTQWHPAFCSAMRLELMEDAEHLDYRNEYNLNSKPLQMDLLVIKKAKEIELKNEIGKIFRTYNIIEYKSPDASMNLNTYLKVVSYACLYKTHEKYMDEVKLNEITITLVREKKPKKLLQWFEKNGYPVIEKYKGIYYIISDHCFPTQVIVSKELSKEGQKWLTLLTQDLDKNDVARAILQIEKLSQEDKEKYGDSVLQVAMKENKLIFSKVKQEDVKMCEALRELMEPELREAEENGKKQVILNAIKMGSSIEELSKVLGITSKEIQAIVNKAK